MQRTLWILVAASLWAANLPAQDYAPDPFARGLHAYFDGQTALAHQSLAAAIAAGSEDPRAYYFRGLANFRLGRPAEAEADFQRGAQLEHNDLERAFPVDRTLERVQGPSRLAIERYRAIARSGAAAEAILERSRRIQTAEAARPQVAGSTDTLFEQPTEFDNFAAPAAPRVKGEVDKPFDANEGPVLLAAPKPDEPNPLVEPPLKQAPAAGNPFGAPAPAPENGSEGGAGRALGNALRRAFGGLVPEVPAVGPLGGNRNAPPAK